MASKHTYIIAEAGVNHNGDKDKAIALIEIAAKAKADAVKFQTFSAEKLAAASLSKAAYQKSNTGNDDSQYAMLKKLELPLAWHAELKEYSESLGIEFMSTAFDADSLRFLGDMNLSRYKIPSGEITNAPLVWQYALLNKPLILSTGMSSLAEIEMALMIIAHAFSNKSQPQSLDEVRQSYFLPEVQKLIKERVTLLHCTSQYPAPMSAVNLNAMLSMQTAFQLEVGYSDHTQGNEVSVAATALGATVIEKHFTLSRDLPGPDHKASLEPDELAAFVSAIRNVDLAMGNGIKGPQACELDTLKVARQSLVAAQAINAGECFTAHNVTTQRTGGGISPIHIWDLIGSKAQRDYQQGEVL